MDGYTVLLQDIVQEAVRLCERRDHAPPPGCQRPPMYGQRSRVIVAHPRRQLRARIEGRSPSAGRGSWLTRGAEAIRYCPSFVSANAGRAALPLAVRLQQRHRARRCLQSGQPGDLHAPVPAQDGRCERTSFLYSSPSYPRFRARFRRDDADSPGRGER